MDRKYEWQEANRRLVPEITASKQQEFWEERTHPSANNPGCSLHRLKWEERRPPGGEISGKRRTPHTGYYNVKLKKLETCLLKQSIMVTLFL